jgi:hypothetical protein
MDMNQSSCEFPVLPTNGLDEPLAALSGSRSGSGVRGFAEDEGFPLPETASLALPFGPSPALPEEERVNCPT